MKDYSKSIIVSEITSALGLAASIFPILLIVCLLIIQRRGGHKPKKLKNHKKDIVIYKI